MAEPFLALRCMRTALITGANKGIGFALTAELADRLDRVLLTGRDAGRVAAAVARIGKPNVEGVVLDVSDPLAVQAVADSVGEIDVVVSNASAMLNPGADDEFVQVANGGTHAVLRSFGPYVKPGGRLVVVASSLGTLHQLDPALHPLIEQATSLDDVEKLVTDWRAGVTTGWPDWVNIGSKVLQVAAVRAYAARRREADARDRTLVMAVCPGLVDTPLSRPWFPDFSRALTPEQAGRRLADQLERYDPAWHGELVRYGTVLAFR